MKYSCGFLLLFILQIIIAQPDKSNLLMQASEAYLEQDYDTAQALYETIIEGSVHDPGVYFNLGNTYYEMGDLGRAMLNYRRAQQFWARDEDLIKNLILIRSERIDIQGDETAFVEGLATLTDGVLTLLELSILVGMTWTAWFILLGLNILKTSWRERLRLPLIIIGIVTLIGVLVLGSRIVVTTLRPSGVVIQQAVQVRSGPGQEYLELYQLHAAADVRIWQEKSGWVQFALPDGRLGWLPSQAVEMIWH